MGRKLKKVDVKKLKEGMVLGQNLYDSLGNILLSEGITLKQSYIVKIQRLDIPYVYIEDDFLNKFDREYDKYKDSYLLETRLEAKSLVKKAMEELYLNGVIVKQVLKVVNKLIEELLDKDEIIISLEGLRTIDDYTLEHSVNVCIMALAIGITFGLNHDELMNLGAGSILHDIGKMVIPKEILNKPGPLTKDEYEIVKTHTIYGYDILKKSKRISEIAAEIALYHHERLDGSGYPFGKRDTQINMYCRIVMVADVYDALTSDRVYKKRIEGHKALEYMCKMADIQFDKDIVNKLLECIKIYPIGTLVKLNTNEIGLVVNNNKLHSSKPVIKIVLDQYGKKVKDYLEVDINKNPDIEIINILPNLDGISI